MRDLVSCFSEHAVRVSETTCSSYTTNHLLQIPLSINTRTKTTATTNPALQTSVTLIYKITLSSNKQLHVTVTWTSTQMGPQGLTISFGEDPSSSTAIFKLSTISRLFRKKKGSKSIELEDDDSRIELFWDLSEVTYGEFDAEPINGYFILLMVDSEIALILGDLSRELASKKIKNGACIIAKNTLVSRKEHYSGTTLYSTKAQFSENGAVHEISIKCSGESEGLKQPVLIVSMDKRTVMKVKKLQWNFRGNQTIFSDGLLIDLFWDVHDWFFSSGNGGLAVFMFRRRSGIESRLWLEEKLASGKKKEDQDKNEFSLLIYASKI